MPLFLLRVFENGAKRLYLGKLNTKGGAMRTFIVGLLFTVASLGASASERVIFENIEQVDAYLEKHSSDVMLDGYTLTLSFCRDDNCKLDQAQTVAEMKRAYEGNYQGQRNLAYCLWSGCNGAIVKAQTLGCAWRIVILASGSPEVGSGDVSNLTNCVERLSRAEIAAAKAQARSLYKTVYGRDIPADWR